MLQDWILITGQALQDLWVGFIGFIPSLIAAIIVFVIGWIISSAIGKVIAVVLTKIKFNQLFAKGALKAALDKAELKVDAAGFIGDIVKWVLVLVFLLAAVDILGLPQFGQFLQNVLAYLPNVVVAAVILVAAVIVADIAEKVIKAGVESVQVGYATLAGEIAKWSIWIFAILAILNQLSVAPNLIEILFTGIIAVLVISFGLAFGMGGKDMAGRILEDLKRKLQR